MSPTTDEAFEDEQKEVKVFGARYGSICAELITELNLSLRKSKAGKIYGPHTTFQVGAHEQQPAVGFISAARLPATGCPMDKWEIPPDLAVEIIRPDETWGEVADKKREYFAAGVRQVWLVSQPEQEVMIYDSPTQIRVVTADQDLTSETLLPGFKCRVATLFQS